MSLEKRVTLKKEEIPAWHKSTWGTAPANWREVDQNEFVTSGFFTYGSSHQEYSQFHNKKHGWFSGTIYYILDRPEGVAMQQSYENGKFVVKFYRFANCIHKFEGVSPKRMEELTKQFPSLTGKGTWGNCCHNSVCVKCGDYRFTDSSD